MKYDKGDVEWHVGIHGKFSIWVLLGIHFGKEKEALY